MPSSYYKVVSVQWHDPTPPRQARRREQQKREPGSRRREVKLAAKEQRDAEPDDEHVSLFVFPGGAGLAGRF